MKRYKLVLLIALFENTRAFQSSRNQYSYKSLTTLKYTSSSFQDASEPYVILDLQPGSVDLKDIKRAYRKMALKYHPDAVTGANATEEEKKKANDRFAKVNAAYAFLVEKSQDLPPSSDYYTHNSEIQRNDWHQNVQQTNQSYYNQYEKVKIHQSRSDDYMNWNGPRARMKPEYGNWTAKKNNEQPVDVKENKAPQAPVSTTLYCKGDYVKILSGEHRGSYGKIMTVYPNMVRVEINPTLSIFLEGKAFRLMTASERSDLFIGQPSNAEKDESDVFVQTTITIEDAPMAKKVSKRVPPPPPPPPPRPSTTSSAENFTKQPDITVDYTSTTYSWNPSKNLTRKRDAVYQWNHQNIRTSSSFKNKIDEISDYRNKVFDCEKVKTVSKRPKHVNDDVTINSTNSHLTTNPDSIENDINSSNDGIKTASSVPKATNLLRKVIKVLSLGILAANIAAAMGIIWG